MKDLALKLTELVDVPWSVLVLEGKLTKKWAVGVKKWWREWMKKTRSTKDLVGKKDDPTDRDLKNAIKFVEEGKDRIRRIREDMYHRRGLFPFMLTGDPKKDIVRGKNKTIAALWSNLKNHVAYITDEAIKELDYAQQHLRHCFDVCTNQEMAGRMADPWPPARRYGSTGDQTAWENSVLEVIPEKAQDADKAMEKMFRKIREFATAYEKEMGKPREEPDNVTEFTIHGTKVVAVQAEPTLDVLVRRRDKFRAPSTVTAGVKELEKVYRLLKKAGFDSVWYGTIFLYPESERYQFTGKKSGKTYRAGGDYRAAGDVVRILYSPHDMAGILIHELGHRYYYRCMRPDDRSGFDAWFERVKPVTSYGGENPAEDFAEVFSAYVLGGKHKGQKLSREQAERFLAFAKPGGKARRCR